MIAKGVSGLAILQRDHGMAAEHSRILPAENALGALHDAAFPCVDLLIARHHNKSCLACRTKTAYIRAMSPNTHKVAFVRDHPRMSERSQRDAMKAASIRYVYTDLALCVRQRRKGLDDVVVVRRLFLLAEPKDKRKLGGARQSLWNAIDAIEATGSSIFELDTGRSSLVKAERDAMTREAIEMLAQSRARSDRIGRPPKPPWSDDDMKTMRLHWQSRKHRTNADAIAAMRADGLQVTASIVGKVLGPSGRKPGSK